MANKLPRPIKKQREVLYLPVTGHSVVLGTAGSGKTTLALYRATYLSALDMPHTGKTLLLTFNKALVTYLNYLKPDMLINVNIENYHKFARGYLNKRNKMSYNCICDIDERPDYVSDAIKNIAREYPPHGFFNSPIDFFLNEIQWILSHGITKKEDYLKEKQEGRNGSSLPVDYKPVMFEILQEYIKLRSDHGKIYDWDDIATHVKHEFFKDETNRFYRHIIIDEGQDFSPEMIRSLVAAIPSDGSLTFFGDVAQQIYGQRTSWRLAGLEIEEPWYFKENYRNTKQISQLGLAISKMSFFDGINDLVEPTAPNADGPLPTLLKCQNNNQQINKLLDFALNAASTQSVAILVKNREQEKLISSELGGNATQLHRNLKKWNGGPGIFHGTYHSAKGLEFDNVILPFLDSENLPDYNHIESYGEKDALTHDGRLLYVAVTRAKTNLLLLYNDNITPLLPPDKALYREVLI